MHPYAEGPEIGLPFIHTLPSFCCLRDLKFQFTKLYVFITPKMQEDKSMIPSMFFLGLWEDAAARYGYLQDGE